MCVVLMLFTFQIFISSICYLSTASITLRAPDVTGLHVF